MRRKERKISDKAALETVIRDTFFVSLAMPTDKAPYQLPMNFGYDDGKVYLHSAQAGTKLAMLRAAGGSMPVSLLFVAKASLMDNGQENPCDLSTRYASVVVTGILEEVTDTQERMRGLRCLAAQVGVANRPFTEKDAAPVAVLKVTATEMIGKVNDPA